MRWFMLAYVAIECLDMISHINDISSIAFRLLIVMFRHLVFPEHSPGADSGGGAPGAPPPLKKKKKEKEREREREREERGSKEETIHSIRGKTSAEAFVISF